MQGSSPAGSTMLRLKWPSSCVVTATEGFDSPPQPKRAWQSSLCAGLQTQRDWCDSSCPLHSESSSVWPESPAWNRDVAGSNPASQTNSMRYRPAPTWTADGTLHSPMLCTDAVRCIRRAIWRYTCSGSSEPARLRLIVQFRRSQRQMP